MLEPLVGHFKDSSSSLVFSISTGHLKFHALLSHWPQPLNGDLMAARTAIMETCAECESQDISDISTLASRMILMANQKFLALRPSPPRPLTFVILIESSIGLYLSFMGIARVLKLGPYGCDVLIEPSSMAHRMAQDGLVATAGQAPEKFLLEPTMGLGLPTQSLSPTCMGPLKIDSGQVLLIESPEAASLIHPQEYDISHSIQENLAKLAAFCKKKGHGGASYIWCMGQGASQEPGPQENPFDISQESIESPDNSSLRQFVTENRPIRRKGYSGILTFLAVMLVLALLLFWLAGLSFLDWRNSKPQTDSGLHESPPIKTLFKEELRQD